MSSPCHPCSPGPCSSYACCLNCTALDPYTLAFTLHNLSLIPGYYTNQSDPLDGDAEYDSDHRANTMISLFTDHFQPAAYYMTVQATTASGQSIVGSSNGVVIDTTAPEQIAPIDHFDIAFSTTQPTGYQSSNDTIAARWAFRDLQSGVVDYQWSIGTTPGGFNIQPFLSVGTSLRAENADLLGLLAHNTTYYVTVIATNGAGLSANATSSGIIYSTTELNSSALQSSVSVDFVRAVDVRNEDGNITEILVAEDSDRSAIYWDRVTEEVEQICKLNEHTRMLYCDN